MTVRGLVDIQFLPQSETILSLQVLSPQQNSDLDLAHVPRTDVTKTRLLTGKRRYHQKSRKGCSTCKRRRVKCDEGKPLCMKCQHMNLVCGYTIDDLSSDDAPLKKPKPSSMNEILTKPLTSSNIYRETDDSNLEPELAALLNHSSRDRESRHSVPSLGLSLPSLTLSHPSLSLHLSDHRASLPDLAKSFDQRPSIPDLGKPFDPHPPSQKDFSNLNDFQNSAARFLDPPTPKTFARPNGSPARDKAWSISNDLLAAGNLNNINLSQLVNNLSGLGNDLSSLGNVANLSNLAMLAQLPIDLNSLGALNDTSQAQKPGQKSALLNAAIDGMSSHLPTPNDTSASSDTPSLLTVVPGPLNMMDLRLFFNYTSKVCHTITAAGISDALIWSEYIPTLAFQFPFLMHLVLAFSATHLSRTESGLDPYVTSHRGKALQLLREAVLDISVENTDALVSSAIILIMDSLANASFPLLTSPKLLPALAWIFHVKGAATILTAVWPLTPSLRFYNFISVDLGDLGDILRQAEDPEARQKMPEHAFADLNCHDHEISDLFPVPLSLPYVFTLAYLNKLHRERYKLDLILRMFAFPALLDKTFMLLLMRGDVKAMRIMRLYYKMLRTFTAELKDTVWFLEGVSQVLPVDVDEYAGGAGGMHMMLDFLGGGPAIVEDDIGDEYKLFDPAGLLATKLADADNLPSEITSNMDIMQGDQGFIAMNMRSDLD